MTDPLAKIWSKSYLQAANIKAVMDSVTPGLINGVEKLGAVVSALKETSNFGRDLEQDVLDAIEEADLAQKRLSVRLQQVLADLNIIIRAVGESTDLTEEVRLQVSAATSHLQEAGEMTAEHANTAANVATLASGMEYLMLERDKLEKILGLADPKLVASILKRMNWRVKPPVKAKDA